MAEFRPATEASQSLIEDFYGIGVDVGPAEFAERLVKVENEARATAEAQVAELRAALEVTNTALGYTVTSVEPAPHWCRSTSGKHDPTCATLSRIRERNGELLATAETQNWGHFDEKHWDGHDVTDVVTHCGKCGQLIEPPASSRFLDLDAPRLRDRVAEVIHDATPPEQDGGVPDVCNRYPEHEAIADALLATLRHEPGDT